MKAVFLNHEDTFGDPSAPRAIVYASSTVRRYPHLTSLGMKNSSIVSLSCLATFCGGFFGTQVNLRESIQKRL